MHIKLLFLVLIRASIPFSVPLLNVTWKCKSLGFKEDSGYVTAKLFLDYAISKALQKKLLI